MATRTIKTLEGKQYQGDSRNFIEQEEYIEYRVASGSSVKIPNSTIAIDSQTKHLTDFFPLIYLTPFLGLGGLILLGGLVYSLNFPLSDPLPPPLDTWKFITPADHPCPQLPTLFAQPYIDPLTNYIQTHASQFLLSHCVTQVDQERLKRCQHLKQRYQPFSTIQLRKLQKHYTHSCPELIKELTSP